MGFQGGQYARVTIFTGTTEVTNTDQQKQKLPYNFEGKFNFV